MRRPVLLLTAAAIGVGSTLLSAPPAPATSVTVIRYTYGGAMAERPRAIESERFTIYYSEEVARGTWGERHSGRVRVEYQDCRVQPDCVYRTWERDDLGPGELQTDPLLETTTLRTTVAGCVVDITIHADESPTAPEVAPDPFGTSAYQRRTGSLEGSICGTPIDASWSAGGAVNRNTWTYVSL